MDEEAVIVYFKHFFVNLFIVTTVKFGVNRKLQLLLKYIELHSLQTSFGSLEPYIFKYKPICTCLSTYVLFLLFLRRHIPVFML